MAWTSDSHNWIEQAQKHVEIADQLEDAGEFDKALAECDRAIQLDPDCADAYNLRGVVLEDLGLEKEALADYKQAIRLDPYPQDAKENLAALKKRLMVSHDLVTVATFSHPAEAYMQKAKLDSEGIQAFVVDDCVVAVNWLYSLAVGGVKLQVAEPDVEKALETLSVGRNITETTHEVESVGNQPQCPKCGSLHARHETFDSRAAFISHLATMPLLGSLGIPLPIFKPEWVCSKCGYRWKPGEKNCNHAANGPTDSVCPKCSKPVSDKWRACPYCGETLIETVGYYCETCGKDVDEGWKVCPYCGDTLDDEDHLSA